jgi:hypothetical protein
MGAAAVWTGTGGAKGIAWRNVSGAGGSGAVRSATKADAVVAGSGWPLMLAMAASDVRRKAMCDSAIERWYAECASAVCRWTSAKARSHSGSWTLEFDFNS